MNHSALRTPRRTSSATPHLTPTITTSSARVCLLALCLAAAFAFASPVANAQDPDHLRGLDETERRIEELRKKLEKTFPAPKDAGDDDVTKMLKDALDVTPFQKQVEAMREASLKVKVTDADARGLQAYCSGRYAEAAKAFRTSLKEKPGRPLPHWFLGAIAFQNADYAESAETYAKVVALDPKVTSAHLMHRLATKCIGKAHIPTAKFVALFGEACRETMSALNLKKPGFSFAMSFTSPLTSDPVLFKALELVGGIRRDRTFAMFDRLAETNDPDEQMTLTLILGDKENIAALVADVARKHPERRDFEVFAFLMKYYGPAAPDEDKRPETYAAELARARSLEPQNAALMLLRIADTEVPGERYPQPAPLTLDELRIVRRASLTKEWRSYWAWKHREAAAVMLKTYGGYAAVTGHGGLALASTLRCQNRAPLRIAATIKAWNTQGKYQKAKQLWEDARRLYRLVGASDDAPVPRLVLAGSRFGLARAMAAPAHAHGDRRVVEACINDFEDCARLNASMSRFASNVDLPAMLNLPVRRFVETLHEIDSAGLMRRIDDDILRDDPKRFAAEALDDVRRVVKYTEPGEEVASCDYRGIVLAGDLRAREALPMLEKIATFKDPVARHLALRAIARIRGHAPKADEPTRREAK